MAGVEDLIVNNTDISSLAGGMFGGILIGIGILIFLVIFLAVYVYFAMAWMTIAKKLKYKKAWLAWIPFANIAMILQLGGFHWAWVFLAIIPLLGWLALIVLCIIATWRIFEKRKYPGWFSLSLALGYIHIMGSVLYLIAIGFVAWKDKKRR